MNLKKSTFSSPTMALALMASLVSGSGPRMTGMPPRGVHFDQDDAPNDPPAIDPLAPPVPDGKKKVEFTPEQQEFLEKLNNEAFAKGFNKAEKQSKQDKLDFQKQLDDMKKLIPAVETPAPEGRKAYAQEEVESLINDAKKPLEDKLLETERKAQVILAKEKTAALRSAAVKAKAADDEDVAVLLDRFVAHDAEGNLVVLNKEGHPALDAAGKPQTVDGFVKAFVDSKPHLQAHSGKSGAGSGSSNQGGNGKAAPIKSMADARAAFAKGMANQTVQ